MNHFSWQAWTMHFSSITAQDVSRGLLGLKASSGSNKWTFRPLVLVPFLEENQHPAACSHR